jgi:mRNA interferase MazF
MRTKLSPRRGEIWWTNFDPSVGEEIQKIRPAVIISNNAANKQLNRVQVVPVTSSESRQYPGDAEVNINGKRYKTKANQLSTVSNLRLRNLVGSVTVAEMEAIEAAVRDQLYL